MLLLSLLFSIASGADLTATSAILASKVAGAAPYLTVKFTTAGAWTLNGQFSITFPANFVITNLRVDTGFTPTPSTAVLGTATITNQVALITRTGAEIAGSAAVIVRLIGFTNPTAAGATGAFTFSTLASNGSTGIDTLTTVAESTIVAATVNLAHLGVGDATKTCDSLYPAPAAGINAETCTASQTCDLYLNAADTAAAATKACVVTTNIMVPGTQAATGKVRCLAKTALTQTVGTGEIGSKECSIATTGQEEWCNPGSKGGATVSATAAERCVPYNNRVGSATVLTMVGSLRVVGDGTKICIGRAYYKACPNTDVCNPYTATEANICLTTTDVLGVTASAHGATGTDTGGTVTRAAAAAKSYCIAETLDTNHAAQLSVEEDCKATEVCNYAALTTGDTCLLKADLLGTLIADTASWTRAVQVRQTGAAATTGDKWCLTASAATVPLYFSEKCVSTTGTTQEVCNPWARTSGDVCVVKTKVIDHGVFALLNADACLGDADYNLAGSFATATKSVCNWGGANEAGTFIVFTDLLNAEKPTEATRTPGALNTAATPTLKYCLTKKKTTVGKSGAAQCKVDDTATADVDETEVCNPNGEKGGTLEKAICVPKKNSLAHAAEVDKTIFDLGANICIGVGATNACKVGEACNYTTGVCVVVSGTTAINLLQAPFEAAVVDKDADTSTNTCFGASDHELCTDLYYCNPFGTVKGGEIKKVADALETHICVHPESLASVGGYVCPTFPDAEEGSTNANATLEDATSFTLCTETKPICGADGKCYEEADPEIGTWLGDTPDTPAPGGAGGVDSTADPGTVDPTATASHASMMFMQIAFALIAAQW